MSLFIQVYFNYLDLANVSCVFNATQRKQVEKLNNKTIQLALSTCALRGNINIALQKQVFQTACITRR